MEGAQVEMRQVLDRIELFHDDCHQIMSNVISQATDQILVLKESFEIEVQGILQKSIKNEIENIGKNKLNEFDNLMFNMKE